MNKYWMALILFLSVQQSAFANTGAFFNLSASGPAATVSLQLCLNAQGPTSCQNYTVSALNLSISTTIQNHVYPAAGIKITTPGYTIANSGINCTPLSNGYCAFSVSASAAQSISLLANDTVLTLSPSSLAQAVYNSAYSANITASGGFSPYTYALTSGSLPTGLSLASASGLLSGTPTATGVYNFTVTATDPDGSTGSQGYSLVVGPSFSPSTLASATLGALYEQPISLGSSGSIYTCSLSGAYPPGLDINQLGACALSGFLSATGTYSFTVTANGGPSVGSGSQNYSITVYPEIPTTSVVYSSSNPSTTGSPITLSAQVSSANGSPTIGIFAGTVNFSANGTTISGCGSQSFNQGVATCTTSALSAGTNAIVATFSGGGGYAASTSATFNQSVAATVTGTVPAAPNNVTALPSNGQVNVSWYPPANTGGTTITGYTVLYGTTVSAIYNTAGCTTSSQLSCLVNSLSNGTAYTFTVVANNANGTGPAAFSSSVTPESVLTASPATLALSGLGDGAARAVTITNNSTNTVTLQTISAPIPSLPAGSSVTVSQTNACTAGLALTSGASCAITITPGPTVSSGAGAALCTTGIAPIPSVITVTDNNNDTVSINALVLGYGCQYQEGYLFSMDDTTPITTSIGGKVVTLSDQNSGNNISWTANLSSIWGMDDASTIASPDPNASSPQPATLTTGQLNCNAVNDGSCATNNLFVTYGLASYAVGLCKATINGYTDWYLPSVCELGPFGSTGLNQGNYPSENSSQVCLAGSTNIQNQLAGTSIVSNFNAGTYWSSIESSSNPEDSAWYQSLVSSGSGYQANAVKSTASHGVRCARGLTI